MDLMSNGGGVDVEYTWIPYGFHVMWPGVIHQFILFRYDDIKYKSIFLPNKLV
jgi:hypothetical protein